MNRDAAQDKQVRQHVDDVHCLQSAIDPDSNALARKLVDDVQHSIFPAVMGAVLDEVIGPDVVGMLRPQPHARAVVQPEPTPFGLLMWNLEPLASPDPRYPLGIHPPASLPQHRGDATIAIAAELDGERRDVRGHGRLVIRLHGLLPLRGTVLAQNPAGEAFRHPVLRHHMVYTGAATRGAQKFPEAASFRISFSSVRSDTARRSRVFSASSSFSRLT